MKERWRAGEGGERVREEGGRMKERWRAGEGGERVREEGGRMKERWRAGEGRERVRDCSHVLNDPAVIIMYTGSLYRQPVLQIWIGEGG